MNILARFLRFFPRLWFILTARATIKDIPTELFKRIIAGFKSDGWNLTYEYSGIDAWIDYGCVVLVKESSRLKFEWDNWTEGSIEGPGMEIEAIARQFGLTYSNQWRWDEYNDD